MAIVNLGLMQLGEVSRVLLLIHFHLLGKCSWNRCGPFGLSQETLWHSISLRFEKPGSPRQQTEAEKPGAADDRGTYNGFEAEVSPVLFPHFKGFLRRLGI